MFHVPAHKHVGPNPPGQLVFRPYAEGDRPRPEVRYEPMDLVIGGRRIELALHPIGDKGTWRVSDPKTGRRLLDLCMTHRQHQDVRRAAGEAVRDLAVRQGDDVFFERINDARRAVKEPA